jgi:RNA polymerase sigma factor (sigma-70 family)
VTELPPPTVALAYYFARAHLPALAVPVDAFAQHISRAFTIYTPKCPTPPTWNEFLTTLYARDFLVVAGCLHGLSNAWETLFAARTGRTDCLLVDALRARAARLYPRDAEKQETAVDDFWSGLLVPEHEGTLPTLMRYDGQRPLTPWLIRVFQNLHLSRLRSNSGTVALPEDDLIAPMPVRAPADTRWHDAFTAAAREWLDSLSDKERLILGLRWRYKLSQRDAAVQLKIHEGTLSRQTDKLRDRALEVIGEKLVAESWTGDDLEAYILNELGSVLTDDPRMGAEALAALLPVEVSRSLPPP